MVGSITAVPPSCSSTAKLRLGSVTSDQRPKEAPPSGTAGASEGGASSTSLSGAGGGGASFFFLPFLAMAVANPSTGLV